MFIRHSLMDQGVNVDKCHGTAKGGGSQLSFSKYSHGHAYTPTVREVLLTAWSRLGCCLRNRKNKKRMTGASTGLVDTGST